MSDKTIVLRGRLHWAKVLGDARPHTGRKEYDKGPYWSVDLTPDEGSRQLLEDFDIENKLRDPDEIRKRAKKAGKETKEDRTETFLSLRVLENKKDGGKNKHPPVTDVAGNVWPENVEIGNDTVADVKVNVVDYGAGSQKGMYLKAIRILSLVEYEREEFEPLSEDDEFFAASTVKAKDTEVESTDSIEEDDEVPF